MYICTTARNCFVESLDELRESDHLCPVLSPKISKTQLLGLPTQAAGLQPIAKDT